MSLRKKRRWWNLLRKTNILYMRKLLSHRGNKNQSTGTKVDIIYLESPTMSCLGFISRLHTPLRVHPLLLLVVTALHLISPCVCSQVVERNHHHPQYDPFMVSNKELKNSSVRIYPMMTRDDDDDDHNAHVVDSWTPIPPFSYATSSMVPPMVLSKLERFIYMLYRFFHITFLDYPFIWVPLVAMTVIPFLSARRIRRRYWARGELIHM